MSGATSGKLPMSDPVASWHAEHVHFVRLLRFLEAQLEAFQDGRALDYALMHDVVHYLQHVADGFHHPREDEAFRRLAARDAALEVLLNRLLQEHRVLAVAGATLLGLLDGILEDVVVERSTVEAAAAQYLLYYRHHLAKEESEILPRAAQLLTADDWTAVATAIPGAPDTLFGAALGERYRQLSRHMMGQAGATSANLGQ
jgi:hemerythrin-like domain-containing protein